MPFRTNFQLGRLFGIRIGAGISWFLVLFLFIFSATPYFHEVLGGSRTTAYLVAVASVMSYFGSIILHELGHAIVARRNGIGVSGIDLWAFGGITRMTREPQNAPVELRVSAAGPFVTLLTILLCIALGTLLANSGNFFHAAVGSVGVHVSPWLLWLSWLATINTLVLVLNLIPAFPLDGGRIAHALIWWRTGNSGLASAITGRLGQLFAILLGLGGLFLLTSGYSLGIWLLLAALFVYQGAGAAVTQGAIAQRISGITVADVMDREPVTIPADTRLIDSEEEFFLRYRWPWFAVVDSDRHFLGIVRHERVQREVEAGRPALPVAEVLEEDLPVRIAEEEPLESLLRADGMGRLGAMMAVDHDGVLRGVVTIAQVRRALRPAAGL
jgi:Zn-dependent protease